MHYYLWLKYSVNFTLTCECAVPRKVFKSFGSSEELLFHLSFINLVLHVCMKINKLDVTAFAILYKLSVQAIQVIIHCQQYRL